MTNLKLPARALAALSVLAGSLLPAGLGPAKADTSANAPSGNENRTKTPPASRSGPRFGRRKILTGMATSYGRGFHGRPTASGERFNMNAMTLACRRLPMGTRVRVTNLRNGRSVVGRINDIGPNGRARHYVADLSTGMARKIGYSDGHVPVRMEVLAR